MFIENKYERSLQMCHTNYLNIDKKVLFLFQL